MIFFPNDKPDKNASSIFLYLDSCPTQLYQNMMFTIMGFYQLACCGASLPDGVAVRASQWEGKFSRSSPSHVHQIANDGYDDLFKSTTLSWVKEAKLKSADKENNWVKPTDFIFN